MKDGGRKEGEAFPSLFPFAIRPRPSRPSVFRLRRMTNPLELFAGGLGKGRGATYFYAVLLLGHSINYS